ncbi:MAG: YebG family protein [Kangiellaceae bacterium]|nr:YebG family protein [Kangiellaceae bacterium]
MAVVTLYMSDRDSNKTFTDKKAADNYDKMLELAENVSLWIEKSIEGLSEEQVESIGMLVAENKDLLAKAIKAKPEILLQQDAGQETNEGNLADENVTKISA